LEWRDVPVWLATLLLIVGLLVIAREHPQAQAPPIGQGGASPQPPFVNQGNHMVFGGPLVKLSGACGTAGAAFPPVNNGYDSGGFIAMGSDMQVGDTCNATFNRPYVFAVCVASSYEQNIIQWSFNNQVLSMKLVTAPTPPVAQPALAYLCYDVRQPQ
jgi:hypothetical protein